MVSSDLYGSPFDGERSDPDGFAVTPFTGVWIEIRGDWWNETPPPVTPFTGVWIEIPVHLVVVRLRSVTPFTGVWIEI